jgi:nitrogen-specific signal transduction histidine kinase
MTQTKSAAAEAWLDTSDAVLRGLNHEFSNRLSLARLAPQLSELLATGEHDLARIAADSNRSDDMVQLLRLYRLMVFSSTDPAEPLLVADVAADAIDLFKHHTVFRDLDVRLDCGGSIQPILLNPTSATQAVLLLLCAAARQLAVPPGDSGAIVLRCACTEDAVSLTAAADESPVLETPVDPPELPALRYLIRNVEGQVAQSGPSLTMSLGTLLRLRRLEKQG